MKLLVAHDKSFASMNFLLDLVQEEVKTYNVQELVCSESCEASLRTISEKLGLPLTVVYPIKYGDVAEICRESNRRQVEQCHRALLMYDGQSKILSELLNHLNLKSKKYRVVRHRDLAIEEIDPSAFTFLYADETTDFLCQFNYGKEVTQRIMDVVENGSTTGKVDRMLVSIGEAETEEVVALVCLDLKFQEDLNSNISWYIHPNYISGGIYKYLIQISLDTLKSLGVHGEAKVMCNKNALLLRKVFGEFGAEFCGDRTTSLGTLRYFNIPIIKED